MTTDWAPAHLPRHGGPPHLRYRPRHIDRLSPVLFRRSVSRVARGSATPFPAFPMAWALVQLAEAAQNPLKHSAPRNRLHGANGVSSSRHLSRRRVDGRCGFECVGAHHFRPLAYRQGTLDRVPALTRGLVVTGDRAHRGSPATTPTHHRRASRRPTSTGCWPWSLW
jgi:hypothetical protein